MPNGCPMEMLPPLTLYFSLSMSSSLRQYTHCDANASLSSHRSTSSWRSPAFSNKRGMAYTGPMPISSGSQAATVKPRYTPMGVTPSWAARSALINNVIEAPSESCEALPAVTVPSSSNAGGRPERPWMVVFGRLHSSRSTVTSAKLSSPVCLSTFFMVTVIGTISSPIKPAVCALA